MILSIGSRSPISPVEQTATSIAPIPRASATASAVRWVSAKPSGPVQAFAPPEFKITARSVPVRSTCSDHCTGAALTRLLVNSPAAAYCRPVVDDQGQIVPPARFQAGTDRRPGTLAAW